MRGKRLFEWIRDGGGFVHEGVTVEPIDAQVPQCGVRVVSMDVTHAAEDVFIVPEELILHADAPIDRDRLFEDAIPAALSELAEKEGVSRRPEERLALRLMLERYAGHMSKFAAYLAFLPPVGPNQCAPVGAAAFNASHMAMLRGTYVSREVEETRKHAADFADWVVTQSVKLRSAVVEVDVFSDVKGERVRVAMKEFATWAFSVVLSRALVVASRPGAIARSLHNTPLLTPGVDLLNHAPGAVTRWSVTDEHGGAFHLVAGKELAPGSELFNEYAQLSNAVLLARHGFSIPANPYDSLPFVVAWPSLSEEERTATDANARLLRKGGGGKEEEEWQGKEMRRQHLSGRYLHTIRTWLLHAAGFQQPIVTVQADSINHPRGHRSSHGHAGLHAAASLFNVARIAALPADALSPAGLRRLWQLNHPSEAEDTAAGKEMESRADALRRALLEEPSQSDALDWSEATQNAITNLLSPWNTQRKSQHLIVPRGAELRAMQTLWGSIRALRAAYPSTASNDVAALSRASSALDIDFPTASFFTSHKKRRQRRGEVVGDTEARRRGPSREASLLHSAPPSDSSPSTLSLDHAVADAIVQDPFLRHLVICRLGELRLLDSLLQAIRSQATFTLGSKDAAREMLAAVSSHSHAVQLVGGHEDDGGPPPTTTILHDSNKNENNNISNTNSTIVTTDASTTQSS